MWRKDWGVWVLRRLVLTVACGLLVLAGLNACVVADTRSTDLPSV